MVNEYSWIEVTFKMLWHGKVTIHCILQIVRGREFG